MLAELEDEYTRLAGEHDRLIQEAERVAVELERVEAVRAAMMGKPKPSPRRAAKGAPTSKGTREEAAAQSRERVERIRAFARANGGSFTGRQAADAIGMAFQGVGPVLAGMVRRGEATVAEAEQEGGPRIYTLAS